MIEALGFVKLCRLLVQYPCSAATELKFPATAEVRCQARCSRRSQCSARRGAVDEADKQRSSGSRQSPEKMRKSLNFYSAR
jgi:hypothetical protein